jgi:hypothetical protein
MGVLWGPDPWASSAWMDKRMAIALESSNGDNTCVRTEGQFRVSGKGSVPGMNQGGPDPCASSARTEMPMAIALESSSGDNTCDRSQGQFRVGV